MPPAVEDARPSATNRSVLIVDDYVPFRGILRRIIGNMGGYTICGEAATGAEALEMAKATPPDIAIVDLNLKTANGIDLTKQILACCPKTSVLIISLHAENLYAEAALRAGAHGYLMKEELMGKAAAALEQISRGELYMSEYVRTHVLPKLTGSNPPHGR
jgi:DNA-binding NarL/FixJ family response regulator